ncbi:response regulator transcription factor [Microbispora sp. H10830]|uniref:response regulator transcription factor n=1 Tax=Microbispora sp. H10830 TaxID=2729109 RepID=UPI0016030691|nr:response regulator transcription factor [Microbispora sp. H10830]
MGGGQQPDDATIRTSLTRSLRDRGHAVSSASTALAGLRSVVEDRPDLIVLDLGLPDMDGADDCVVKPYSVARLDARIRAVLRRVDTGRTDTSLTVGTLRVDAGTREATLDGAALDLTPREFDLLHYLAARAGQVVTKRELLTGAWRVPYGGTDKTVDVHLSWLRRKLGETAQRPRHLQTVRGVGVRLTAPPSPGE